MNAKKSIAYETECPSCLSLIRFESHEIQMENCDNVGTITCPVCRYRIKVMVRTSKYGLEAIFSSGVRPIYEKKVKKKIKDITIGELNSACEKHECAICPFSKACDVVIGSKWEELEEEIEVPEKEQKQ